MRLFFHFLCFLAATLALFAGCSSTPKTRETVKTGIASLYPEPYSVLQALDVIYATNRVGLVAEKNCSDGSFGITPGKEISFGVCRMTVPPKRPVGVIQSNVDPFQPISHKALTEDGFRDLLRRKKDEGVLVFVHGFNVKYDEAVLRAAQLAFDLKFQGAVLLLSWPAGAGSGLWNNALVNRTYENNKTSAAESVGFMASVFRTLSRAAEEGVPLYLMVHSMGHQVVLPALVQAEQDAPDAKAIKNPLFDEMILNAPDFPVEEFEKIASAVTKSARRTTLYCSSNDNAIAASGTYNKTRRLGSCARTAGIDVINVSEVDAPILGIGGLGHGYYSSRPVLTDLFQLLLGFRAENRLFIRKAESNGSEDFVLRP